MTTAVTPQASAHAALGALASRLVDVDALPWQPTRHPGVEVKTLLFDRASGLVTALTRMAPGAVLPDHEHVRIEQTFVLEGHLVDRDGPDEGLECRAGQFVWRPAGSRHTAWSPRGGLFLALFQIPNRFFEADGRITDMAGVDWQSLWGAVIEPAPGTVAA
jgi:anti-sigma factor ChrR (cupin superfamily)